MWDKCLEARALGARGLGSEFYSFIGQHGKVRETIYKRTLLRRLPNYYYKRG